MAAPLKYELLGASYQTLRFTLAPGQTLIGESGAMMFMSNDISYECRMGDGTKEKETKSDDNSMMGGLNQMFGMMKNMAKRVMSNESLFNTWFTNNSAKPARMALAGPKMGTIVAVQLNDLPQGQIIAQSGAFLASAMGVKFTIEMVQHFGAGFFGGEGFILQRMIAQPGSTGEFFMHGGGTIIKKDLKKEKLTLEAGSLMAFTNGITYNIGFPGFGTAVFGGGGLFMATLEGTGSVWIQSTADVKIIDVVVMAIPQKQQNN